MIIVIIFASVFYGYRLPREHDSKAGCKKECACHAEGIRPRRSPGLLDVGCNCNVTFARRQVRDEKHRVELFT